MPTETDAFENLECVDQDVLKFNDGQKVKKSKNKKNKIYDEALQGYRSGSEFISSVDEWNVKYYNIDFGSQIKKGDKTEDEVCDSESKASES